MKNDLKITFRSLVREDKLKLFTDWVDGKQIEHFDIISNSWKPILEPRWNNGIIYRTKESKDSINWDHVATIFKYMVRDEYDEATLYEDKPFLQLGEISVWLHSFDEPEHCRANVFSSYKKGSLDWKNSLIERDESTEINISSLVELSKKKMMKD